MNLDPIIAVKDVEETSKWYQSIFDCKSRHGGSEFEVLVLENEQVFLCLHKWNAHEHPTMKDAKTIPGNGLILYFRTTKMKEIRQRIRDLDYPVETEIQVNPNSHKKEFSLRDPNGYYWTISEFHQFDG